MQLVDNSHLFYSRGLAPASYRLAVVLVAAGASLVGAALEPPPRNPAPSLPSLACLRWLVARALEAGDELRLAPLDGASWDGRLLARLHLTAPVSLLADVSRLDTLEPAADGISVRVVRNLTELRAAPRRRALVVTSEASCDAAAAAAAGAAGAGWLLLCGPRALADAASPPLGRWDAAAGRFVGARASKVPLFGLLGATLRVATVDYPPYVMHYNDSESAITTGEGTFNAGVEFQILTAIRSTTGTQLKVKDYGEDSWNMILGTVRASRADVAVGGFLPKHSRLGILDMSVQYWTERVKWVLPAAKPLPHWQSIAHVFPAAIWLVLVLMQTTAWLLTRALARRYAETPPGCLELTGAVLGISVSGRPRNWPLRLFFYSWLLYCQQINVLFQTSLMAVMTDPRYGATINSMEELVASGWDATALPGTMAFMMEPQDARINAMLLRTHKCTPLRDCVRRLVSHKEKCLAVPRRAFQYELAVNFPHTRITKYKMLDEDVITSGVVMYFCKNSPFKKPINMLLSWIVQSGLTEKWNHDILAVARVEKYPEHTGEGDEGSGDTDDEVYTPLSLENMKGVFAVFFLGHIVGLFTFIIEQLYSLKSKQPPRLPKVKKGKANLVRQPKEKSIRGRYCYNKNLPNVGKGMVFLYHKAAYSNSKT